MKKKLLSILSIFVLILGVSGCGNSAPKEVTVTRDQGEVVKLEVGKDIAEGEYTLTSNTGSEVTVAKMKDTAPNFTEFDTLEIEGSFCVGFDNKMPGVVDTNNITLSEGDYLFVAFAPDSIQDPDYRNCYIADLDYNEVKLTQK